MFMGPWWLIQNPPTMQETCVRSLGWEDPLEKGMATHSSVPAWRIPWTEEPGRLQSMGLQRVGHSLATEQQESMFISQVLVYQGTVAFPMFL